MTDLAKLRAAIAEDEYIHMDDLRAEHGIDGWDRNVQQVAEIPTPPACVFCSAPWTPEMVELVELSGYCPSCADGERVIDVFCSACTRLVYRKEVR